MTVKEFLSFRKKDGFLNKVTIWKSCQEDGDTYQQIAEFNPEFYEVISKEVLDLEVENFDIDIEYGSDGGVVLLVFVNQENSTKKIQELFNR
ncbi:hypothetical protein DWX89_09145 [Coprobacillus sp. AF21-8LB]|jgi:hypothetical protein|nr:hypothetical protein DWX89_09145 [Coprobacillus sp. AF21-8LB]DAZ62248.1 MAG TPA: hypothetical protein [Caudoviricetes sp.]